MSLFINIPQTQAFFDATGAPLSGQLTITPSSSFRIGTNAGQGMGDLVTRAVVNGSLADPLKLADPAQTSPEGIGYTFTFTAADGYEQTWADVLVVPDSNGNFDLAVLNTGQWIAATPKTVISVNTVINTGTGSAVDNLLTLTASGAISQYLAVSVVNGVGSVASSSDLTRMGTVQGVAVASAVDGAALEIQYAGEITNPGWNFAPGVVFLGPLGQLTQTPPTSGYLQVLGYGSGNTVLLSLQDPIQFTS